MRAGRKLQTRARAEVAHSQPQLCLLRLELHCGARQARTICFRLLHVHTGAGQLNSSSFSRHCGQTHVGPANRNVGCLLPHLVSLRGPLWPSMSPESCEPPTDMISHHSAFLPVFCAGLACDRTLILLNGFPFQRQSAHAPLTDYTHALTWHSIGKLKNIVTKQSQSVAPCLSAQNQPILSNAFSDTLILCKRYCLWMRINHANNDQLMVCRRSCITLHQTLTWRNSSQTAQHNAIAESSTTAGMILHDHKVSRFCLGFIFLGP